MNSQSEILHEGYVEAADNDSVTILLSPSVSCHGCQAESTCGISGATRKIIKVTGKQNVEKGEKVIVSMKTSQGFSAVVFAYVIPLVILVCSLAVMLSLSLNELVSGLVSIVLMMLYYLGLFFFRKMIGKRFSFTLKKAVN